MYIRLLVALVLAVPAAAAAQVSPLPAPATGGPSVRLSLPAPPAPGPYANLFRGPIEIPKDRGQWRVIPEPKREEPEARRPRTKVVCGMTLILVDPVETDRGMTKPVPNEGTRFTMRSFPAPACRDK
jgi:hypothetical protein